MSKRYRRIVANHREMEVDWETPTRDDVAYQATYSKRFHNGTPHIVHVLHRDGIIQTIHPATSPNQRSGVFEVLMESSGALRRLRHSRDNRTLANPTNYERAIDRALARDIENNHPDGRTNISTCASISASDLSKLGTIQLSELDIVITIQDIKDVVHPSTTTGDAIIKAEWVEERERRLGVPLATLSYYLVDRDHRYPDFWLATGFTEVKLPRISDRTKPDGIYVEHVHQATLVNHGGEVVPPYYTEHISVTDNERLEALGIYRTEMEAKEGGNWLDARKRQLDKEKTDLEREKLEIERLKHEYQLGDLGHKALNQILETDQKIKERELRKDEMELRERTRDQTREDTKRKDWLRGLETVALILTSLITIARAVV